jgi:broad specificity phosphatase PhoE
MEDGGPRHTVCPLTQKEVKTSPQSFSPQHIARDVLVFASAHSIRMIAARWLGQQPSVGQFFFCDPTSVGVLKAEHDGRDQLIIRLWIYVGEPRQ